MTKDHFQFLRFLTDRCPGDSTCHSVLETDLPQQFRSENFLVSCSRRGWIGRGWRERLIGDEPERQLALYLLPAGLVALEDATNDFEPHKTLTTVESEPDAWLPCRDIARQFGVPAEALAKRLERLRRSNDDAFREIADSERKPGEPRFLYNIRTVLPTVEALKARGKGTDETSVQRPSKKK